MFYDDCEACHRRAPYCAECCERAYRSMQSTAYVRGERWAERTLRALRGCAAPWPDTPKSRGIAAHAVRDLDGDEQVRRRLADDYHAAAAQRWERLRASEDEQRAVLTSTSGLKR